MPPITLLISDDEPLAVSRLAELVLRMDDVTLVGEASDGQETLELIETLNPDVVLLDIEMPILDGFDVIEHLSASLDESAGPMPLVIFITAYPQFAVRAFETGALDFIPKPVRYTRLVEAIDRARSAYADREARQRLALLGQTLDQLRQERSRVVDDDHYLWVPRHGEVVRVDCDSIDWIKAEGEYVRLYCDQTSYLYRQMIGDFVAGNDTIGFLRVHRSAAVNVARIVAIKRSSNGGRVLRLSTGDEVAVGRKYAKDVMAIISPDIE
ncbi:LytR/AlgR family response regulator transcription factor [Parasphingorhabdus cellanae]|uniref:Response regulator transcription factor n=1 Tax=Parasphingorhabdus cellanae TaxID=2806553 RepID=A0ABX7SZ06_9SPHN|nr:LytTR family DNA-binding domain-containing protein [Parasphingorhabdus cellanae]QTD54503.1 response regulator transcription factor [Parasphingorhabdus cellanae]